jgi:predicted RNase H-like HicB family nuclease
MLEPDQAMLQWAWLWHMQRFEDLPTMSKTFTAVIEICPDTGLYVGHVPGFPGAHSQGKTLDELRQNLQEVLSMLTEDGEPVLETQFVGTQTLTVD